MAEENNIKVMSLERINREFAQKNRNKNKKKKNKNKSKYFWSVLVVGGAILLLLVIAIFWEKIQGSEIPEQKPTSPQVEAEGTTSTSEEKTVESTLTKEEQEAWDNIQVDGEKVHIDLNTRINVSEDGRAQIRLANPIYNAYTISIEIFAGENREQIFYQSEKLAPGTILDTINLLLQPEKEVTEAIVEYTIYDSQGIKGVYPEAVQLITTY